MRILAWWHTSRLRDFFLPTCDYCGKVCETDMLIDGLCGWCSDTRPWVTYAGEEESCAS